jgi:hypothetical protein
MRKHRQFMARAVAKMIEDNKSHIDIIQKNKTFFMLK